MEIERFKEAVKKSRKQIKSLRGKASERYGEEKAKIFDAHILILDDPAFVDGVRGEIKDKERTAPMAVEATIEEITKKFASLDSEYMSERASDVRDVGERVISNLTGALDSVVKFEGKKVILAEELLPSDTIKLPKDKILGFCTEKGGKTAHVSIIARSMGCPAVVGVEAWDKANNGDEIILDGDSGEVVLRPD